MLPNTLRGIGCSCLIFFNRIIAAAPSSYGSWWKHFTSAVAVVTVWLPFLLDLFPILGPLLEVALVNCACGVQFFSFRVCFISRSVLNQKLNQFSFVEMYDIIRCLSSLAVYNIRLQCTGQTTNEEVGPALLSL